MNHTRTRTDSRRGRIAAREDEREQRRTRLRLFLARADRGVLSPEDCTALRGDVEAEVAESDTHRRSAGGQQAAAMRLHRRIAAAEQCLVETETERDQYATEAEALRQQLGEQHAVEEGRR
ncbi:hypothetical protein N4G70_17320 [Streptomyces sp. ASQP_92]|uniref:hypothetical protein n=1 Tax=Streptomyces sp. ASQP_92 TaxID=2979116 RepID=UPI0021BF0897|nr:hypothetical protein [Streptomyces sp. ASQP_92]MCT9090603.1 hypothetical protein [Streptomyces sp. ASQP_92]